MDRGRKEAFTSSEATQILDNHLAKCAPDSEIVQFATADTSV